MTGLAGMRVMRGPHWDQGDMDGGEGHLGTVTGLLDNGQVQVLWDKGQESACNAGADGKFDLRVFDTAQAGVRHPNTKCAECGESHIFGTLWRCQDCDFGDLCPLCYGDDKHDIRHRFQRIDHHNSESVPVKKRKVSVRMRSMGTFPGAKVTRGRDWAWADQDGGPGSVGDVQAFENVAPDSSRNLICVQWRNGKANSYRLGFRGTVDLTCVEEEVGPFYYRDHLPLLDVSKLPYPLASPEAFQSLPSSPSPSPVTTPPSSSSDTATTTGTTTTTTTTSSPSTTTSTDTPPPPPPPPLPPRDGAQSSSQSPPQPVASDTQTPPPLPPKTFLPSTSPIPDSDEGAVGGMGTDARETTDSDPQEENVAVLGVGDEVMVGVNENTLRDLQEDYGGVSDKMIRILGQKGRVMEVNTGVVVRFGSSAYRLNPMVLVKVWPVKEGDVVRIRHDVTQVKLLSKHVAWNQQIADTCGSVGRIQAVHKEDVVTVTFGHFQTFRFSSACCVPAPSATPDPLGTLAHTRRAAVASTEAAARAQTPPVEACGGHSSPRDSPAAVRKVPAGVSTLGGNVGEGGISTFVWKNEDNGANNTGNQQNAGTDSDTDMHNALLRMMGMMKGSGSDNEGSTDPQLKVLFSLISRGHVTGIQTMVQANRSLLMKTEQTLTPLMYACHKGQQEVVTSLLELGADVNGVGGKGRTPLYVAIDSDEENIAIMLLQRGANPNTKNQRLRTPLHAAAYEENMTHVTRMLLCMGADVNAKDQVQDTPLFDAIEKGHDGAVKVLLEAESLNPQELNAKGFNMLQLACLKGQARTLELILSYPKHPGADELLLGEYSALHIAANNDHVECVGILVLLGGAAVDIRDGRRKLTPLHLACKRRNFKSAEALIGLGASVNACDINNNTPLHLAMGKSLEGDNDDKHVSQSTAVEQRTQVACLLLSNGAVADVRDDQGRLPLAYGLREVQDSVQQYLINVGVGKPGQEDTATSQKTTPASHPVGVPETKITSDDRSAVSKQDDTQHLNDLLRGVSIQCATCDAMSDVTLEPCGHKVVCRKCCEVIYQCPQCGTEVEEKEPDNTDEQDEEEEDLLEKQAQEKNAAEEEEEREKDPDKDEDEKDIQIEEDEEEELNKFD